MAFFTAASADVPSPRGPNTSRMGTRWPHIAREYAIAAGRHPVPLDPRHVSATPYCLVRPRLNPRPSRSSLPQEPSRLTRDCQGPKRISRPTLLETGGSRAPAASRDNSPPNESRSLFPDANLHDPDPAVLRTSPCQPRPNFVLSGRVRGPQGQLRVYRRVDFPPWPRGMRRDMCSSAAAEPLDKQCQMSISGQLTHATNPRRGAPNFSLQANAPRKTTDAVPLPSPCE